MSEALITTDVVVVGSGVSGLAAALEAAQGGARVSVFEKQPSFGGTSNFFEGIFAVGSAMQKEQYIAYTRDQAFMGAARRSAPHRNSAGCSARRGRLYRHGQGRSEARRSHKGPRTDLPRNPHCIININRSFVLLVPYIIS